MVKLIMGLSGSGKTKTLVELVNEAVNTARGDVVCIEKRKSLTYDIPYQVRLVEASAYGICSNALLYGFLCGLYSQNYDISAVFIDSLYKITGSENAEEASVFFDKLGKFAEKTGINFTITISVDEADLPANAKAYL